jgi:hypothetical protein
MQVRKRIAAGVLVAPRGDLRPVMFGIAVEAHQHRCPQRRHRDRRQREVFFVDRIEIVLNTCCDVVA